MVSEFLSRPPIGLGGFQGSWVMQTIMLVFTSLAFYNAIELVILILLTFHRYRGLYFWVMLLSSVVGVIPHALGYLLEFFYIGPLGLALTISTIGFYIMVPGQSVVLYSRLHLVVQNPKVLRRVLYLIIFDAIILLIPTTVLTFSSAYVGIYSIVAAYNVMERIQLTWFCAQEFLISGIYIYETVKLLRLMPEKDSHRNQIMYELLAINCVIILMDIALLVLEYVGLYPLQTTLKAAVYSVKLKLELGVLTKLVELVHPQRSGLHSSETSSYPAFVDPTQVTTDVTHPAPVHTEAGRRRSWDHISMETLPQDGAYPPISRPSTRATRARSGSRTRPP